MNNHHLSCEGGTVVVATLTLIQNLLFLSGPVSHLFYLEIM